MKENILCNFENIFKNIFIFLVEFLKMLKKTYFYYFFALSHFPSKLVGDGDCVTNNDDWGWWVS